MVAQAFAQRGYIVAAADTQRYGVIFAHAMLGIGRKVEESCSFSTLTALGLTEVRADIREPWTQYCEREAAALARSDAQDLVGMASELPLFWRLPDHPLRPHILTNGPRSALGEAPLLTGIYAGSYLGVQQAIVLDEIRQNAELAKAAGRISVWQYNAALTAIMSAASAASHSAGKHFAQPLTAGSSRNVKFLTGRLLQDRRVDIENEFKIACNAIDTRAVAAEGGHQAWLGPAENFVTGNDTADLYYLDPPYTAQQYSRFYHVLETICTYEYPQLFGSGGLTTGLYPTDRYKSAFSSKVKAGAAFQAILSQAYKCDAAVVISYSQSSAASNGNARMISLEQLLDLCSAEYGRQNVNWLELSHRYRQFNSAQASNSRRDDPEILITCKQR